MIQLLWNCQGLGNSLIVHTLGEMILSHNPSIVFLMETKQKACRMNQLRKQFGFRDGVLVDPTGTAGGLCLWWNSELSVDVLGTSKNLIEIRISLDGMIGSTRCTYMYSPPYRDEKPAFWDAMLSKHLDADEPWAVLGYFNEILGSHEKVGGAAWCHSKTRYLDKFMNSNGLIGLGFQGLEFTWIKTN